MFKMSPHIATLKVKGSPRLQIMKAIRGQDWGDKETLRLTYQALVKPIMAHNATIWFPSVGPDATSNEELQITGGHKVTSREHLLAETNFLPVAKHIEMICAQFLASAYREEHPSHKIILLPTGNRLGRKGVIHTLQSRFNHCVEPYLKDGILPPSSLKQTQKAIHTATVAACKRTLKKKCWTQFPQRLT
jgi:hypothetical protein